MAINPFFLGRTIRTEQLRLLQDNGTENIEFFVYDKDGVPKNPINESKDVLKQVPSVMQPINDNLVVEYLRPLKDVEVSVKTQDKQLLNKNPNFRYNTFDWDITAAQAIVAIPSQIFTQINPISGIYCLYQELISNSSTGEKTTHMIKNLLSSTSVVSGRDIEISYNYYVVAGSFPIFNISQFLSVGLDSSNDGSINKMYNFETSAFETGDFTNDKFFQKIDITQFDAWNKYTTILKCNLTSTETAPHIEVKLFKMTKPTGIFEPRAYYDGFEIKQTQEQQTKKQIRRRGASLLNYINEFVNPDVTNPESNITGVYEKKDNLLSNEIDLLNINAIDGEFTRKDRPISTYINTLDKCVLQEILNDFRSPVKRYEGEFYKNDSDETPLYFYNKLWINFGTTILQEPVSAIIDEMEYNVKQNLYRIVMHLPNADDDQAAFSLYEID